MVSTTVQLVEAIPVLHDLYFQFFFKPLAVNDLLSVVRRLVNEPVVELLDR